MNTYQFFFFLIFWRDIRANWVFCELNQKELKLLEAMEDTKKLALSPTTLTKSIHP